jgi:hypothetical protein
MRHQGWHRSVAGQPPHQVSPARCSGRWHSPASPPGARWARTRQMHSCLHAPVAASSAVPCRHHISIQAVPPIGRKHDAVANCMCHVPSVRLSTFAGVLQQAPRVVHILQQAAWVRLVQLYQLPRQPLLVPIPHTCAVTCITTAKVHRCIHLPVLPSEMAAARSSTMLRWIQLIGQAVS